MFEHESLFDTETKTWSGRKVKEFYNPKITLGELVRKHLIRNPKHIGQISADNNVSLNNGEILLRSLKIGLFVQKKNIKIGDVVGVIARNTENLAPLVFGLLYCGAALNTLDTSFSTAEIIGLFKATRPKMVFCDTNIYEKVKSALDTLENAAEIFLVDETIQNTKATSVHNMLETISDHDAYNFRPCEPSDGRTATALIVCSSGTTGPSKGVCLSHASLMRMPVQQLINSGDVYLCFSSLYWLSGFSVLLLGTIAGTTRIITSSSFNPDLALQLIDRYKVSKLLVSPSQLELTLRSNNIKDKDLSSLEICLCSGSLVLDLTCKKMQKYLQNVKLAIGYGLSELGGISNLNFQPYKNGSVGKISENVCMKIIDNEGNHLGPNEHGEICSNVPYKFLGYYSAENDNQAIVDKDGWIHTGDIGYFDGEGFLFVIGRSKDIMKYRNFPVSPTVIENVLLSLPGIEQACVCGVPDSVATDLPAALIVRKAGSSITMEDVDNYMREHLSDSKQLRGGIYFVEHIPMTASGKYQRHKVKGIAEKLYREKIQINVGKQENK